MPEGPEIHRAADRVRSAVVNRPTERVFFGLAHLASLSDGLTGQRVVAVQAHGKAMLTEFEDGRSVFTHNQLYGRWYVVNAGQAPSTGRSLRFAIETETKRALLYSASTIEVLTPDELPHHPFLSRLGPDPLHDDVTVARVQAQLQDRTFRGRALGGLLLDQSFVAGLGNYLRSEILFRAGVAASRRPRDLTKAETRRLARSVIEIVRRAYETGGITNDPQRVKALKRSGARRRAYRHFVFGRGGQPCYACGAPVRESIVAGRRLFDCPACQPGSDGACPCENV